MNKTVTLALVLVAGLLLGAFGVRALGGAEHPTPASPSKAATAPAAPPVAPAPARVEDPKAVYRVPVEDSPARGPDDALVTIIEFSEVECPFCKRVAPTVARLEEAYRGKLRLVWKHFPLPNHANALPAALVAEAARARGGAAAFWSATDALLALPALDPAAVNEVGKEAGLDPAQIRPDAAGKWAERVFRDQALGRSLGVSGTPTFFVNGRKLVGAQPYEAFRALVDEELARARALVASGTSGRDVYARTIAKGASAPVLVDGPAPAPAAAPPATAAKVTLRGDDPIDGPRLAPVTIALFSDFQCPFCARVEPTLRQVQAAHPGKVRIVWKHQPLPMHPQALPAARAAEAARAQGKFWEMQRRLFSDPQALGEATFARYAKELGLDGARFRRDLAAEAAGKRIAEDQALAAAVGASGTPTFFVNCRRQVGALPLEAVTAVVEEELARAEERLARGEKLDAGFYGRVCDANVAAAPAPVAPRPAEVAIRPDDPAHGPAGAKVTIVEFSDFQCPFCSRALPAVKEVEEAFGKDVRLVWKHLPLDMHPQAMPAALAAEAARAQGKFWEMHDRLFAAQQALSAETYQQQARELGLDLERFSRASAAAETRKRVEEDLAAARAAGVSGTPTFVVNGEVVLGAGALRETVKRHLERAGLARR